MERITKTRQQDQEILIIDFSDSNVDQMIEILSAARDLLIREQRSQKVLAIFNNKNYVTGKFMRHFETYKRESLVFIDRQAIIGLSAVQRIILKCYNMMRQRDIKAFDSKEEALKYLLH